MNIGITYDLRDDYLALGLSQEETAEFDRLDTILALEETISALGFQTDRIGNLPSLVRRLAAGTRWDLVFNIAEGLHGFGREAQVPALLEAFGIPCTFSDSLALAVTLHKGMTKRIVRDLGIRTPDFIVIEETRDLDIVNLSFPLFVKPVAEGTGKGIDSSCRVTTPEDLRRVSSQLLERWRQPVLVEAFLPGREFTVGILGTGREARVVGAMEVVLGAKADRDVYSYENKEQYEDRVQYFPVADTLAAELEEASLIIWRGLGCRDAGRLDFRADEKGFVHFLEINPLAGIHPHHSDLPIICALQGISYRELIAAILDSALKRVASPDRRLAES